MWFIFEMCYHFQNVEGLMSVFFSFFSKKHDCKQKLETKICTVTTNSFTDEVVKKQQAFRIVSAFKMWKVSWVFIPFSEKQDVNKDL